MVSLSALVRRFWGRFKLEIAILGLISLPRRLVDVIGLRWRWDLVRFLVAVWDFLGGGGRRISVSLRLCRGWRILARKRMQVDGFVNNIKKLQRREISSKRDRMFSMRNAQERFQNIQLQVGYGRKCKSICL